MQQNRLDEFEKRLRRLEETLAGLTGRSEIEQLKAQVQSLEGQLADNEFARGRRADEFSDVLAQREGLFVHSGEQASEIQALQAEIRSQAQRLETLEKRLRVESST